MRTSSSTPRVPAPQPVDLAKQIALLRWHVEALIDERELWKARALASGWHDPIADRGGR
jgi:hypothetical protein